MTVSASVNLYGILDENLDEKCFGGQPGDHLRTAR